MWCSNCQQDVPAIATPDDDKVRCTKCREEISSRGNDRRDFEPPIIHEFTPAKAVPVSRVEPEPVRVPEWAFVERPPIDFEAWRWDEDLFEAERLLQIYRPNSAMRGGPSPQSTALAKPNIHRAHSRPPTSSSTDHVRSAHAPRFAVFAWAALSLGVMAVVFGGVLLGWSVWFNRPQLWTLGMPFAIGGQAGLLLGLILQLEGIWQNSGNATRAIENLDEQIDELREATAFIAHSHAHSFESVSSPVRHHHS